MEAIFLKLVNMSLTASWLVLAVIALRSLLKNVPKYIRVILWGFVGIRLIFPFSLESIFSLIPSSEPLPEEFLYAATPQVNTGIPALNEAINPLVAQSLTPNVVASANPTQIWSFIFSQIWILGMVLMLIYALVSYQVVKHKVAASIKIGDNLRLCDHIESPFILGIFRPVIYLPSELDPKTADMVLAHEYAHLQRKDHWWKPLGFVLLCVYWFNPILWLAYILLCRDIELACDEKVISQLGTVEKKAYSSALLRCSINRRMIAACPLAFGEVGVKDRIKSVLNYKRPAFWIIAVAVVICVVVAVCFLTDPVEKVDPMSLENWGITITAKDPSSTGVTLVYNLPDKIEGEFTIPLNQTLLQKKDEEWVEILTIVEEDGMPDWVKWLGSDQDSTYQRLEWRTVCGALEPGQYSIRKTLWLHQDGLGYQKDFYADFSIPMKERVAKGTYTVTELLYRNPMSSHFSEEADTPSALEIHSGCNILTSIGSELEENPNVIWGWRKLNESGEDVAFTLRLLENEGKLTLSEDTLYQKLSDHYHLLLEEDRLLLVQSENEESVWSVYRLAEAKPVDPSGMTLHTDQGHSIRILEANHYSNGVALQLQVTFPEDTELIDRDVPYPQDVWMYYTTESGYSHATALNLHSRTIDEETHSVVYDMVFSLDQAPPSGKEFTFSLSGFRNSQSNVTLNTPLSMTWSGEVTDARIYEYKEDDAHIRMVLSPIVIHISAKGTNFQSMDELYDALTILDIFGNPILARDNYGGSHGGSLISMEVIPGVPINMDNIGSVSIGEYQLECQRDNEDEGIPSIEDVINSLRNKDSILQIDLSSGEDLILGSHSGCGTRNDIQYAGALQNYSYTSVTHTDFPANQKVITLKFGHNGKICYLKFADNSNSVKMVYDGNTQYYEAVSKYGDDLKTGTIMRKWYDTAEHEALQHAIPAIEGTEADYLRGAQRFCDAYFGTHTQVAEDSMFRYSFVKCDVEEAVEATGLARTRGELDENGYAFWVTVTFVPDSDRGAAEYMAGNTHAYTGSDPDIPHGALQYHMCGYIRLTDDGWVGEIVGTCW